MRVTVADSGLGCCLLCNVFRALINSLVCGLITIATIITDIAVLFLLLLLRRHELLLLLLLLLPLLLLMITNATSLASTHLVSPSECEPMGLTAH